MNGVQVGSNVQAGIFEILMENLPHPTNPPCTLAGARRISIVKRLVGDYPPEKSGPMPPTTSNVQNPPTALIRVIRG